MASLTDDVLTGAASEAARRRKERTYPELSRDQSRAKLVVLAGETGGRFDTHVNDRKGDHTDKVTGVTRPRDDVVEAGAEEMAWYDKLKAFEEVMGRNVYVKNWTQTNLCWCDINKGDNERFELRSRLVAREIKPKGTDTYFAGAPPSALVRYVFSRAATTTHGA